MTTDIPHPSNKNKELLNRVMILEKFIELKSNECAYYRTKVHLMQMSSFNPQITKKTSVKRSSSEDISYSSIASQSDSIDNKHRRSSVPLSSQRKSIIKQNSDVPPFDHSIKSKHLPSSTSIRRHRKEKKTYAQNQNYYEEDFPHPNEKLTSPILISYTNKHLQQVVAHNKNIQCNEKDFHPIGPPSKSAHTVLTIRLPRRFVKSLVEQQKKPIAPKLKVHISSELLNKLLQSTHYNPTNTKKNHHRIEKFTIQSQFGKIAAAINHEDSYDMKAVHATAEIKTHRENRLPIIRHIARTRSDGSDGKNLHTISHKHRRKKRHIHKSSSTSKRSSLTNVTQSTKTLPSSD